MSKLYPKEFLDRLTNEHYKCIIIFQDGDVSLGQLTWNLDRYEISPLTINEGGITFSRSQVKKIILFNGLVFPKTKDGPHKILDIIELNDLINKAGYEFI